MSKIVRAFAELGVYPVFRTTTNGQLVPWDDVAEPRPSWRQDHGIRSLLGNIVPGSDPQVEVDAWYHPMDLAAHFGADPSHWVSWTVGMTLVRGSDSEDVALTSNLDRNNLDYLRARKILSKPLAKARLISSGGAAFFAASAVNPWKTPSDRARIGRLKTKLEVDFKVIRNTSMLPADPVVADLDQVANTDADVPRDTTAVQVATPEPVAQLSLFVQPAALSPEEELRHLEIRAAELRKKIEVRDTERRIEVGRQRHLAAVESFRTAVASATVSAVDLRVPEFNPATPDRSVVADIRIDGVVLTLPDGREFAFGSGIPIEDTIADLTGVDANRAAFEADPVGYTFGG